MAAGAPPLSCHVEKVRFSFLSFVRTPRSALLNDYGCRGNSFGIYSLAIRFSCIGLIPHIRNPFRIIRRSRAGLYEQPQPFSSAYDRHCFHLNASFQMIIDNPIIT